MYAEHFGLTAEPFSLTPDPDFLYLSPAHAEALAAMKVGLIGKRGLMVMTGEVGTGKTTLLYALLRALGDDMRTAYVSNTALDFDGLLRLALNDFGVTPAGPARVDMLTALNRLLRDCAERGVTATLIVDEAQNLDAEAFEQLRLLSNFETFTHKLLQIVLVGQPELEARLREPALRALAERVAVHCRLTPLGERECRAYLDYRLSRAGGSSRLFERDARDILLAAAEGLPRRINILCHNALLFAYGRGAARVARPVAQLAVEGRAALMHPDPRPDPEPLVAVPIPRRVPRLALALGTAAVLVGVIALAGLRAQARRSGAGNASQPPVEAPAGVVAPPQPGTVAPQQVAAADVPVPSSASSFQGSPLLQGEGQGEGIQQPGVEASADSVKDQNSGGRATNPPAPAEKVAPVVAEHPAAAPGPDAAAPQDATPRFRTVRVEPGSTLGSLAREVYGAADPALIKRIQSANPQVLDPNVIMAGDLLRFPDSEPGSPAAQKGVPHE